MKELYNRFFNVSKRFSFYVKTMTKLNNKKTLFHRTCAYILRNRIFYKYSSHVSPKAKIDSSVYFPHPLGLVIGDGVTIGANAVVYQHVTIGAQRKGEGKKNLYPVICEGVIVYAGAVIVGGITVGEGAVIAANSVVSKDVAPFSVVGGVPARPLR